MRRLLPTTVDEKIALLEAVSRERALTDEESRKLERLLNRPLWRPPSRPRLRHHAASPFAAEPAEELQLAMFDGPLFDWPQGEALQ